MIIAYILYPAIVERFHGIRTQALIWKSGLESVGHKVILINSWEYVNFQKFDIIHFFGNGVWLIDYVNKIFPVNPNIVISPIIDTYKSPFLYKLASFFAVDYLRLYSSNCAIRKIKNRVKVFIARSNHELYYFNYSYGISFDNTAVVRLPYKLCPNMEERRFEKENFCFHLSILWQPRKNVIRLIQAAIKYNFRLILAGDQGTDDNFAPIKKLIKGHPNIECLGYLSNEEVIHYYKKAKVFALPSIEEGVGLVALEAAAYGCEIVITNIGGPKEYYNGLANVVDPYDIEDIGKKIMYALSKPVNSEMQDFIINSYSPSKSVDSLLSVYSKIKCNCNVK